MRRVPGVSNIVYRLPAKKSSISYRWDFLPMNKLDLLILHITLDMISFMLLTVST